MALTNTMAIARSFGCEFRFVWLAGTDPSLADPTLLLGRDFVERFRITEEALRGCTVIPELEFVILERADAEDRWARLNEQVFVEIKDPFDVVRLKDDDAAEATRRFLDCFHAMEWSDDARRLIEIASGWDAGENISAVHVRAGDIVSGDWRHTMYYGKYMPLPFVVNAIDQLSHNGERRVLVVSDQAPLVQWLRHRLGAVLTVADIIPRYDRLPEMLRPFADLLVMSRCDSIHGPSSSAFSSYAARIGGHVVMPADRLVPTGQEAAVLYAGILDTESRMEELPFLRPLVARDLIWYLDVFGDELPLRDQRDLARSAVAIDPAPQCPAGPTTSRHRVRPEGAPRDPRASGPNGTQ